jgi:hypothetical protein
MSLRSLAFVFAAAASVLIVTQLAAALGLPIGGIAIMAAPSGPQARALTLAIAVALAGFALVVLQASGLIGHRRPPSWMLWGIVALMATGAVVQTVAASLPVAILAAPLMTLMAITAGLIAFRRGHRRVAQPVARA